MTMPKVQWEWKIGMATVVGVVQLVVISIGLVTFLNKQQSDIAATTSAVNKLESIVSTMTNAQMAVLERVVKVETKVDIMGPALTRIEGRQLNPSVRQQ